MAQFQIAEAELVQRLQLPNDRALIGEESDALFDRELQHLGYIPAAPGYFECLFAIAAAFAGRTHDFHVRHERELGDDRAVAGTFFAAPAFDVKAKLARSKSARLGAVRFCKELAYGIVHSDVRGRVRSRRSADR